MKKDTLFFSFFALSFIALSCGTDPITSTYPSHFVGARLTPSTNKIYLITDDAGKYTEISNLSWKTDVDTALLEEFPFIDSIELPHAFTLLDVQKIELESSSGLKFPSKYSSVSDGILANWTDDSISLKLYWGTPNKELKIPIVSHVHSKGTGKVNTVLPLLIDVPSNNDLTTNIASIIQSKKLKKNDTLIVNWSYKVYNLK